MARTKQNTSNTDYADGLSNERPDFVPFGSERHAAILGLRPATEDAPYVREDKNGNKWTLADTTSYGPQVTKEYLNELLRQQVSVLDTKPVVQSEDRFAPGYAPPMLDVYEQELATRPL